MTTPQRDVPREPLEYVFAQHDETGRIWHGQRKDIPRRYFECAAAAAGFAVPTCDCPVSEGMYGNHSGWCATVRAAAPAAPASSHTEAEDYCGVPHEYSHRETRAGTPYQIAAWACPTCGKNCTCLVIDDEHCHGDSLCITHKNGESLVMCGACWLQKPAAPAPAPDARGVARELREYGRAFVDGPGIFKEAADLIEQQARALAARDAALTLIMRNADAAKEPCGTDPESAAAIRNGKLASLAQIAAQGLGLVSGPDLTDAAARAQIGGEK